MYFVVKLHTPVMINKRNRNSETMLWSNLGAARGTVTVGKRNGSISSKCIAYKDTHIIYLKVAITSEIIVDF